MFCSQVVLTIEVARAVCNCVFVDVPRVYCFADVFSIFAIGKRSTEWKLRYVLSKSSYEFLSKPKSFLSVQDGKRHGNRVTQEQTLRACKLT